MTQLVGIAQALAAQGRNGDSVLIHITPAELKYLQRIAAKHGRTITINPKTGLPEASGLADLVGPLVGIGLSIFAPELSPLWAGLISGAAGGIATGHMESGILGGLLGGGLNSILGGAAASGALDSSIGNAAASSTSDLAAATQAADQAVIQNMGGASSGMAGNYLNDVGQPLDMASNFTPKTIDPNTLSPDQRTLWEQVRGDTYAKNYDLKANPDSANYSKQASNIGSGIANAFNNPLDFYNQNKGGVGAVGVGALGLASYNQTLAAQKAAQQRLAQQNGSTWQGYTNPGSYQGVPSGGYPNFYDPRVLGTAGNNLGTAFAAGGGVQSVIPSQSMAAPTLGTLGSNSLVSPSTTNSDPFPNLLQTGFNLIASGSAGADASGAGSPGTGTAADAGVGAGDPGTGDASGGDASAAKGGMIKLARGGITMYKKGKKMHFAPMPDEVSQKGHHRSITQALRSLYESKASAASDLTNPDSPVSKMGIAGVHDPMLSRAFRNSPPVSMAQGGRYMEGPGDGLSDSIPAHIDGERPARLADGEYVVPADAVSDIGNGSSNAGAKKLTAMVHHIRKKRHGTTKQPGPV